MRNRMAVDDLEGGGGGGDEETYGSEKEFRAANRLRSYYNTCKGYAHSTLFGTACHAPKDPTSGNFINEHSSFRVIGYEIGWMSPGLQYFYCAGFMVVFLVLYGILQEHVVMNKFHRSLGWFVTFLQLSGYGVFAAALDSFVGSHKKQGKIPFYLYIILGFLQVFMQGFTNLSMHYLNYPAKTMFKSSRVIMTMLFGVFFMGKSYTPVNYAVGGCIVCGLTLSVVADAETSPEFSLMGIVLIMLALCADAAILNLQEYCLNKYCVTHDELIYYSFTVAAAAAFFMSLISGKKYIILLKYALHTLFDIMYIHHSSTYEALTCMHILSYIIYIL
jgi:drug/metabolite transporter (DMT)-like permease